MVPVRQFSKVFSNFPLCPRCLHWRIGRSETHCCGVSAWPWSKVGGCIQHYSTLFNIIQHYSTLFTYSTLFNSIHIDISTLFNQISRKWRRPLALAGRAIASWCQFHHGDSAGSKVAACLTQDRLSAGETYTTYISWISFRTGYLSGGSMTHGRWVLLGGLILIRRPRPWPRQGRRLGPPQVWNFSFFAFHGQTYLAAKATHQWLFWASKFAVC